jgi:hypothetical protein
MWDFYSNLSVYQNRLGELVLMNMDESGPILWDFGPEFNDTHWTFVCSLD